MKNVVDFVVGLICGIAIASAIVLIYFSAKKKKETHKGLTYEKKDLILNVNEEYECGKGGLQQGKYTIIATKENVEYVNIKVSGFVRECKNGSILVVSSKDVIIPISHNIILRK